VVYLSGGHFNESKTESKTVPHELIRLNKNGQEYHGFPRYRPIEAVSKPAEKSLPRGSNPLAPTRTKAVSTFVELLLALLYATERACPISLCKWLCHKIPTVASFWVDFWER
jgi:hypothetical protein